LKNTTPISSRATFYGSPNPSQMISSGINALAGMYRSSPMTGSHRA
jgi:hypothetical protein